MVRRSKVFTSLSRRKRLAATFSIKQKIYEERSRCGGIFLDYSDLDASVASGNWNWSDILFLSADKSIYWNAEIITANVAFKDAIEDMAFKEAYAHRLAASENGCCKELNCVGDRSFYREIDKLEEEIARERPPEIYCGYRILSGYRAGIGLQMIVDASVLSRKVIEAAIQDFRARGERRWLSSEPAHVFYSSDFHCKPLVTIV